MGTETIHLLHTNDMHSHFENWPRILRILVKKQKTYTQNYQFNIGDQIYRINPYTDATMGQGNIELMNEANYDGVTIGNNEGLVLSHEAMNHLYDGANFDVLLGNLKEYPGLTQPIWAKNYKIITTTLGTKIAVLGLTAPYNLTYPSLGWKPYDVDETIDKLLPILRQKADVVVLLSHLGLPTDEHLGEKYDIDIIIGAHTHHLLEHGKMVSGTLLAAAGRYGNYVGDVSLEISDEVHILSKMPITTPTYEMSEDDEDYHFIHGLLKKGQRALTTRYVTQIPRDITTDEQSYDAMRALKQYFDAPAAMLSTGMFVEDFPKGQLNQYELLESMPHAINPMLMTLKGQKIIELFEELDSQREWLSTLAMKGSGFRGKIFGYMRFDGIDRQKNGQILYQVKIIQPHQNYQIATLDHYKWVPFFPVIQDAPVKIELRILLRELMAQYYKKKYSNV